MTHFQCVLSALTLLSVSFSWAAEPDRGRLVVNGKMGLSIDARSKGYVDDVPKKWKSSKDPEFRYYTYESPADETGIKYSEKMSVGWTPDSVAYNDVFESRNSKNALLERSITTSDAFSYIRKCTQNVTEERENQKPGMKVAAKLNCNIVSADLCKAYQTKFNGGPQGVTAAELKKCGTMFSLFAKLKGEANETYRLRASEIAKKTTKDLPKYENLQGEAGMNIYSDIMACNELSRLQGRNNGDMAASAQASSSQ